MPVTCEACLKVMTEEHPTRHGDMPEGHVVSDQKYAEIDQIFARVYKDLEFRSRIGLAHNLKRIWSWFRFHGAWFPDLPECANQAAPVSTADAYLWIGDFCGFLAKKSWADEIHLESCAAHREFPREMKKLSGH
jgi:hypothetical protein